MKPFFSKLLFFTVIGLTIGVMAQPVEAQNGGLLGELFKKQSAKDNKSKSKKTSSSSTKKRTSSNSSSSRKQTKAQQGDFLTALTGKTAEERAKEKAKAEYERKKAAEAKAKADAKAEYLKKKEAIAKARQDAREQAIADAAKKKAAEEKARELAAREKQKAMEKAASLARKQKLEEERARELAEKKRADEARKAALAESRMKEARARQLLAEAREKEALRRKLEEDKIREQQRIDEGLVAQAHGRKTRGGGLFGLRGRTTPISVEYQAPAIPSPPSRYLYINEREISSLNSSNSRIEIDLSDQRARVYRGNTLVIETQISSGKSGYTTPTGNYAIQEKLVDKRSGRYGTWYNSSGVELRGDDHFDPPPGASKFVGADMPYWLRFTGGIGMHVGFVPDGPASHGCVRVPSNVQPLIFSKVKVGTPVKVKG